MCGNGSWRGHRVDILKFLNEAGVLRDVIWIGGVIVLVILLRASSISWGDKTVRLGKDKKIET